MLADWRSPRALLLGSASLLASCAALGVSIGTTSAPRVVNPPALSLEPSHSQPAVAAEHAAVVASVTPSPCAAEMVLVERTCVDRFEAHLLEPQADGALAVHPAHVRPERRRYLAASSAGSKPQAYISQVEAAAACENAGKRLCGLTEWFRACTGSAKSTYPYGSRFEAGRCNVGKPHLLALLHGSSARGWSYDDFNDPELARKPGFLAQTGEYEGCTSAEGLHDMVGNLHEWVADRVDHTLRSKFPVPAVVAGRIGRNFGNGIFMGGFFSTRNEHGEGCTFTTAAHDPRYHDYSTGFRCCQDAALEDAAPEDAARQGQPTQGSR